jgi:hypothetical protein
LGTVGKVGVLHVIYKFVNMSEDWFGLVCKLQAPKVGTSETVRSNSRLRKILSPGITPLADLWATFEHVVVTFMRWSY